MIRSTIIIVPAATHRTMKRIKAGRIKKGDISHLKDTIAQFPSHRMKKGSQN